MGAWGTGPFESDGALDFVGELADGPADAVVVRLRAAMTGVLETDDYIDIDDMDAAISAACLVAARIDPTVLVDPNGRHYLDRLNFEADDGLRELAVRVFVRAFEPKDNEWFALWAEPGEFPDLSEAALAPFRAVVKTDPHVAIT